MGRLVRRDRRRGTRLWGGGGVWEVEWQGGDTLFRRVFLGSDVSGRPFLYSLFGLWRALLATNQGGGAEDADCLGPCVGLGAVDGAETHVARVEGFVFAVVHALLEGVRDVREGGGCVVG